jgi:thiamine-monophosphate kinase
VKVSDLGEFPLIDRIAGLVGADRPDVIVGIGDDVAVLDCGGDEWLLAKVDSQVEGTHYHSDLITPCQLGRRALAINLSDIAAAGGRPTHALVSLALPPHTEVAWVEELYTGLREEGNRYGVAIVGGNIARCGSQAYVDVFLLGLVKPDHLMLRSGASPGEAVLVTGRLGDSAAGLRLLLDPSLDIGEAEREALLARHLTPRPRLAESAIIARSGAATAMIDLSDGLSSDIGHVCDRSAVGVRIWEERLPTSPEARRVVGLSGEPISELALDGGEDYELCFTSPVEEAEELADTVLEETGTQVTIIGEIIPAEEGRLLVVEGKREVELAAGGWDHFRAQRLSAASQPQRNQPGSEE